MDYLGGGVALWALVRIDEAGYGKGHGKWGGENHVRGGTVYSHSPLEWCEGLAGPK